MKKTLLVAVLCSLTVAACLNGPSKTAKAPKFSDARGTMAKIGGRPLPVFEFNAKVADEGNKILAARAFVSTTGSQYKNNGESYDLVEPKPLAAEYVESVNQVRATVDPAKEEELATYLNGDVATVAFQIEVDYQAPEGGEKSTVRSNVFTTDHENIAGASAAKELK